MSSYKLLLPTEYIADLTRSVNEAQYRVNMISLVIREDESTQSLIDALCEAAERGVSVNIGMDIFFTYKELGKHSSRRAYLRKQVQGMRTTKQRLEAAGAKVRWLGQFGATLFSRRTHVKWTVVDDIVYSYGGVNLYDLGIAANDYMFRTDDRRLAERMSAEHELVISTDKAGRSYPSHSFGTAAGAVLVDGGRMFDSIIYRHACDLAEQADRIVYVSQYCPTGKLSRLLKQTDTAFYFNHWQNAEDALNALLIRVSSIVHGITTSYEREQYLHAKFILFYLQDGSVAAITGSHNFVASGGTLGTREVALETRDPAIVAQLEAFVTTHITNK